MFINLSFYVVFLTYLRLTNCDNSPVILQNSMNPYMRDRAIALAQNGFDSQWDSSIICDNITKEFDKSFGAEWFAIIGPIGFVANFNAAQNSLIWLQFNDIEIVLYKPTEASDYSVIQSAKIGQIKESYIHSTVNGTIAATIKDIAKQAINAQYTTYRTIQQNIRALLNSTIGGKWLVIVTSSSPNYDSNWDINFNVNYAMEFDIGSLRIYVYQYGNF